MVGTSTNEQQPNSLYEHINGAFNGTGTVNGTLSDLRFNQASEEITRCHNLKENMHRTRNAKSNTSTADQSMTNLQSYTNFLSSPRTVELAQTHELKQNYFNTLNANEAAIKGKFKLKSALMRTSRDHQKLVNGASSFSPLDLNTNTNRTAYSRATQMATAIRTTDAFETRSSLKPRLESNINSGTTPYYSRMVPNTARNKPISQSRDSGLMILKHNISTRKRN